MVDDIQLGFSLSHTNKEKKDFLRTHYGYTIGKYTSRKSTAKSADVKIKKRNSLGIF